MNSQKKNSSQTQQYKKSKNTNRTISNLSPDYFQSSENQPVTSTPPTFLTFLTFPIPAPETNPSTKDKSQWPKQYTKDNPSIRNWTRVKRNGNRITTSSNLWRWKICLAIRFKNWSILKAIGMLVTRFRMSIRTISKGRSSLNKKSRTSINKKLM